MTAAGFVAISAYKCFCINGRCMQSLKHAKARAVASFENGMDLPLLLTYLQAGGLQQGAKPAYKLRYNKLDCIDYMVKIHQEFRPCCGTRGL